MSAGYTIKVKVTMHGSESFFGPGIVELLERIDRTGSVKVACGEMALSYTKAWAIINRAEEQLGYELLNRNHGGRRGGGASLTDRARETITKYRTLERQISGYAETAFVQMFPDGM